MKKRTVLRDLKNCVAGYVFLSGGCVLCRVQLESPAKLVVVSVDESLHEYELEAVGTEQAFSCRCADMRGCCIHREGKLLFVSDKNIADMLASHPAVFNDDKAICVNEEMKQESLMFGQKSSNTETEPFAQRRWPPPPCWVGARYREGRWQE